MTIHAKCWEPNCNTFHFDIYSQKGYSPPLVMPLMGGMSIFFENREGVLYEYSCKINIPLPPPPSDAPDGRMSIIFGI